MKIPFPLILAALVAAPLAHGEAYKCRYPDGRIEISSSPCAGAGAATVSVHKDEKISPERREQAEREAERMRRLVEQREAAQRGEERLSSSSPGRAALQTTVPGGGSAPSPAAIEACLNELDQKALSPAQRAEMESSCRSTATAVVPQVVPVVIEPVHPVVGNPNSVSHCIRQVQNLPLSGEEKKQRLMQCQGIFVAPPPPAPQVPPMQRPEKPAKPEKPPRPGDTMPAPCRPGQKDCLR